MMVSRIAKLLDLSTQLRDAAQNLGTGNVPGSVRLLAREINLLLRQEMTFHTLPWRPIAELVDKHETELLLIAPELVDLDCNVHGVGMGYWQDDGKLWHLSQEQCDALTEEQRANSGSWMACKWSMTNDEWSHVCCTPTHYLKLSGAS